MHPITLSGLRRAGFSLIEVMMSIVIVGGGLVAVFGLFPVGLRQSMDSRSDLTQAAFASAVLESISANVKVIDDLETWEDFDKWWKVASGGDKSPKGNLSDSSFGPFTCEAFAKKDSFSLRARECAMEKDDKGDNVARKAVKGAFNGDEVMYYLCRESDTADIPKNGSQLVLPPQFLIRIVKIERKARALRQIQWQDDDEASDSTGDSRGYVPGSPRGNNAVEIRAILDNGDGTVAYDSSNEDSNNRAVMRLPSRYIVSVVSSDQAFPQPYVENPVFSEEYAFLHRP